jgi:predicted AAA+ superfamily ATPase
MPEAVSRYVETEDVRKAREVQLAILDAYERDFSKHAPPDQVMKITAVWLQVHQQLAKENKKFIFSAIRQSARGRDYEEAIQWLIDAGLIHKSCHMHTPQLPISAYTDEHIFKLFSLDVGLLGAQSRLSAQTVIQGNQLFVEFKGALTENFVAQELISANHDKLYYWTSSGTAEVDFIISCEDKILPLEVKAGQSTNKKSLLSYENKYQPAQLSRASLMNLKHDGVLYNYPLYLISRFKYVSSIDKS